MEYIDVANGEPQVIFCDAVQSLGVHNGVARIALIRLGTDGRAIPAVELLLPITQLPTLIKTLQQAKV